MICHKMSEPWKCGDTRHFTTFHAYTCRWECLNMFHPDILPHLLWQTVRYENHCQVSSMIFTCKKKLVFVVWNHQNDHCEILAVALQIPWYFAYHQTGPFITISVANLILRDSPPPRLLWWPFASSGYLSPPAAPGWDTMGAHCRPHDGEELMTCYGW